MGQNVDKLFFQQAKKDYDLIKLLVTNYNGDYDELVKISNGRIIEKDRCDVDFNNITVTFLRTEDNKLTIAGGVDVYKRSDDGENQWQYLGHYSYNQIVKLATT